MDKLLKYLPWTVVGVLVVIGGLTVLVSGAPFVSRHDFEVEQARQNDRYAQLVTAQQTTTTQISALTAQIEALTTTVAVVQSRQDDVRARLGIDGPKK